MTSVSLSVIYNYSLCSGISVSCKVLFYAVTLFLKADISVLDRHSLDPEKCMENP